MIDKLEYYSGGTERGNAILWVKHPTLDDLVDKINELVEVINAMIKEREDRTATDISDKVKYHCEFKCSACGSEIGVVEGGDLDGGKFNFCPNCGATLTDKWFEKKERLIEQIQGKTPEEIYDFLYWLLITYGNQFTDSRQAVISWLRRDDDGTDV